MKINVSTIVNIFLGTAMALFVGAAICATVTLTSDRSRSKPSMVALIFAS